MRQTITIEPGFNADHLVFDYHGELEPFEVKALSTSNGKLTVNLSSIPVDIDLFNEKGVKFPSCNIEIVAEFSKNEKFSLSRTFNHRYFNAKDLRMAYVLCRRMAHLVEDGMILTLPHAPFYGLSQNFDFRADVPREVMGFEAFKRSILVRRT